MKENTGQSKENTGQSKAVANLLLLDQLLWALLLVKLIKL